MYDLFDKSKKSAQTFWLSANSVIFRQALLAERADIALAVKEILKHSPLHQLQMSSGHYMSVMTSSCGDYGWLSNQTLGYRYSALDPLNAQPWPSMPKLLNQLAQQFAARAGYPDFKPDTCLINRYDSDSKMALHQDNSEQDFDQPVVSFSFGLSAKFLWGGLKRSDQTLHTELHDCDVMVWGGADRLRFHGVQGLLENSCQQPAPIHRFNLTFRQAVRPS